VHAVNIIAGMSVIKLPSMNDLLNLLIYLLVREVLPFHCAGSSK